MGRRRCLAPEGRLRVSPARRRGGERQARALGGGGTGVPVHGHGHGSLEDPRVRVPVLGNGRARRGGQLNGEGDAHGRDRGLRSQVHMEFPRLLPHACRPEAVGPGHAACVEGPSQAHPGDGCTPAPARSDVPSGRGLAARGLQAEREASAQAGLLLLGAGQARIKDISPPSPSTQRFPVRRGPSGAAEPAFARPGSPGHGQDGDIRDYRVPHGSGPGYGPDPGVCPLERRCGSADREDRQDWPEGSAPVRAVAGGPRQPGPRSYAALHG